MENLDDLLGADSAPKTTGRFGDGRTGGRPKGQPNKLTAVIKTALQDSLTPAALVAKRRSVYAEANARTLRGLRAKGESLEEATRAAHVIATELAEQVTEATPADYFAWLADAEPKAYATLLGKLLPTKLAGSDDPDDAPLLVERIERVIVKPKGAQ